VKEPDWRIETVDAIDYAFEQHSWRFAIDEAEAIEHHWQKLCAKNPFLFNGRVLIMRRGAIEMEGQVRILCGAAFEVEFKAFLAWRDFGFPDQTVRNCFAMAALVSADGAFMLGRMSDHTANAGRIYFPAGTPDLNDVKGTRVDLEGSVLRELEEETGILPAEVTCEPGWTIVFEGPRIACMKITRSRLTVAELEARFTAFIAAEEAPELVALHPVFSIADLDEERMPPFTLHYLRHALNYTKSV
jgi:8-oxo-dGTP pyrophosphatase MutT (NUDIX family)